MSKFRIGLVATLFLGITMAVALRAQTRASASASDDAVAALVVEIRALRTELSQVASASVRSQLLVTRVQLQEQRLMHLDRQRADVSGKLADAEKNRTALAAQLKMFENPGTDVPAQQRHEMEKMLDGFKAQVQAAQANEAALRTEQDGLLNAIATEQSRWSDFNNRLDDLERALPATGSGLRTPGTAR
jgi:DNA repair exonuclease SbcCD ATPase subunit